MCQLLPDGRGSGLGAKSDHFDIGVMLPEIRRLLPGGERRIGPRLDIVDLTIKLPPGTIKRKLPTNQQRHGAAIREVIAVSGPSRAMKLFGTEEPVPETPLLRAGPLECSLDAGNLRHIKLHGVEAIRAVSYIVRDRNWGTYNPEISDLQIEQDRRLSGRATTRSAGRAAGLRLPARIEADAAGNLSFAAEGEALTDFVTNRTGFVVLHPVEGVSGAPVEVERVDGSVEHRRFPELIDPTCPSWTSAR